MNRKADFCRTSIFIGALALCFFIPVRAQGQRVEKGQILQAPGARIYFEVKGASSGTPLVLVNGGPGFDHVYLHVADQVWQQLGKQRPVVFYDQRGNGRSPALSTGQSCTLADQIQDLHALIEHLGSGPVDLLGHSWGGFLVMAYAARHPNRIHRLIIVDSAAPKWSDTIFLFKDVYPETVQRQARDAFAAQLGDGAAQERNIHNYLSMLFYSGEKREEFLKGADQYAESLKINQLVTGDLARYDLNPELGNFHFPTLVITGRFDMNVAPAIAYRIHQAIPGSEFAVFEKSGHLPFFEQPEAFAARVERFLGGS